MYDLLIYIFFFLCMLCVWVSGFIKLNHIRNQINFLGNKLIYVIIFNLILVLKLLKIL
ncbi:expressed protein [Phakopsora pachyrhizi]|uniref:Expressed protein n=1 Tax=Phakopsora pachyrhizi TaxID=170000 RepID=A0AAV0AP78_PHAPC|nr:expressed protein [Phakopsora pachyrhizi]